MRILFVEADPTQRAVCSKLAASLGHEVKAADGLELAAQVLESGDFDLLVTDHLVGNRNGLELVRWQRRRRVSQPYVLVLTADASHEATTEALEAGADDAASRAVIRQELVARIQVAEHHLRVIRRLTTRLKELESAMRRLDPSYGVVPPASERKPVRPLGPQTPLAQTEELLSGLRAWRSAKAMLTAILHENTNCEFVSEAQANVPGSDEDCLASTIAMTDVEHKVQLDISIVVSRSSMRAIAISIFGDESLVDDALVADTVQELANGIMGAFKTSFLAEDHTFTAGIPKPLALSAIRPLVESGADRQVLSFRSGEATVTAVLDAHRKQNQKLCAKALREGMVLAEALYNKAGVMLIGAGARLSESLIERLIGLDPNMLVELCDPT